MNPFPMEWEENIKYFTIVNAQCTLWEGNPINPVNIIRTNEKWGVLFEWETLHGLNYIFAGEWECKVLVEAMGPSEGPELPSKSEKCVCAPNKYTVNLEFPAGSLKPGAYKLATTVTMKGPNTMRVQGCAFGGMFCGGQTWTRVN